MYRSIIFVSLVIFHISTIFGQEDMVLKSKVMKVHDAKIRYLENQQLDSLALMLHDDLVYIHSNGWKETKEEVLTNLKSGKLRYNTIRIKESQIRLIDNTAMIIAKGTFSVALDGTPIEINLLYTEVYLTTEKGIVLVSRHACKV